MFPGSTDPTASPARDNTPPRGIGPALEAGQEEEGHLDFRRYFSAVLRLKWLVLGLALLGLAAGVGASRVIKPSYEVQATIQIDAVTRRSEQTGPIRNVSLLEARGWIDLMRSFLVLDEVVRRRRLFISPANTADAALFNEFSLSTPFRPGSYQLVVAGSGSQGSLLSATTGEVLETFAVGDSVGRPVGFRWRPGTLTAGQSITFEVRTPRDAAVALADALVIPPIPLDASFLRVSLRGTDPDAITATVNALAERFVEVATYLKRDKLTQVTEVLGAQLERSAADLRAAENARETFRINTIVLPSDRGATPISSGLVETRDPVRTAFFRLRLDRDSLSQERDAIERALRATTDTNTSLVVTLGAIPTVRSATELAAALTSLAERRSEARQQRLAFGPQHLPLQQLEREIVELERVTVPLLARAVIANLSQRIRDFDERIAASSREMQQIPARVSEEARRERNVEIASSLYVQLQAAFEQARLAELSASPDVRILDSADVPTQPVTDQILMLIAAGFVGGAAMGIFLALLLDRFDRRIRYPDQVTKELRLPILGALPLIRVDRHGKSRPEDSAQLLEAIRSVRMNIAWAHGVSGTFVTTVTSPGAGDGKSFLSANLAKAFASAGRRTLLIDADTRRGVLHHTLEVSRKPGLLDLLGGSVTRDQVIRSVPSWGFDFMPAGTRRASGPELLASPAMAQIVLGLRSQYQAIIIDSPPLGAGVDSLLLGSLAGTLVMVLRSGVTDRELAEARLHDLDRLPIRVLGAILNDVKPEGLYRYYSYLPGYRPEDEREEVEPKKRLLRGS